MAATKRPAPAKTPAARKAKTAPGKHKTESAATTAAKKPAAKKPAARKRNAKL